MPILYQRHLNYIRHMGGFGLMDGLVGRYNMRIKTRKWSSRVFYHIINIRVVNAYLLYQRFFPKNKVELFLLGIAPLKFVQ